MPDDTQTGPVAAARAAVTAIRALSDPGIPRAALDGWCGWGPLAPAFAWSGQALAWEGLAGELRGLLTAADWKAGQQATDTAYHTPPAVAAALWDIITRLGFSGGRVLEPGCGAGHLITAAPPGVPCDWTAVESDPVTARVAAARCPHVTIHAAPLERVPLRRASFDLVIANVPFSPVQPWDPSAPDGLALHNYFLWRGLEALRPGGLLVAVTSRHTLDGLKAAPRRELAGLGDLTGAIRLPSGTFPGTSACADIIVMRRRPSGRPPAGDRSWLEAPGWLDGTQLPVRVSRYWVQHPGMVLGEMTARVGGPHGQSVTVTPGSSPDAALPGAVASLTAAAAAAGLLYQPAGQAAPPAGDDDADLAVLASDGRYALYADGSVTRQQGLRHLPVPAPSEELRLLIRLRDAATALFAAEADPAFPAGRREAARSHARDLYAQYTARYGFLNRCEITEATRAGRTVIRRSDPPMGGFRSDPSYPEALALEAWDDDTMTGQPAAILLRPAGVTVTREMHASDPGDALALCLDRVGRVDLDVIGGILRTDPAGVPGLLAGLIWDDPGTGEWVTAADYLSGDVRAKHAEALAAGPRCASHAAALAAVIPADLPPERITIQLGAAWIPPDVITGFACHLLGIHPSRAAVAVTYTPVAAAWEVRATTEARKVKAAATLWGTSRVNAVDLLEHVLNGGSLPVVTDKHPDGTSTRNEAETALAADKARAIGERFTEWAWEHPGRAARLGRLYNDRHNSLVARRFDGAHLSFPGMTAAFTPWPWQRDMTWMAACRPVALCGHPTGAGKTATACMIALTMRRLGLAAKPAFIVPNHLIGQHAAEARRLYPGARILAATAQDLTPARRRGFAARCAAGDWDLVLMTHEQFEALPVSPATEAAHLANITAAIDEAICGVTGKGRSVKQLARRRRAIAARHEELLAAGRDTGGVTFEQTRIDYLLYDEAHYAKNLDTVTRADGFGVKGSKRAEDLLLKLGHLTAASQSGRAGVLFTATFISNSLAELHTLFRFTCPAQLAGLGLESFDAFAAAHVMYKTAVEVAPDGSGFRVYRRPWQYVNVAALRELLRDVADIRTKASISLPGPQVHVEHVPVHADGLREYTASLVRRADAIRAGGVDPATDNMLAICTDGRRAALDPRLAGLPAAGPGKIEAVAARAAATYHQLKDTPYPGSSQPGPLQLLFCDQGTPSDGKGDQAYGWLRDALISNGVPAGKIAFAHDATTRAELLHLFAGCRDGSVAILIGSTAKCGTGANIQHRMAAIHHVDAPWRPADVEQRDGRGNRPGNCNPALRIFRYVTVGSFDAYMWQALHRKLRWPEQLFAGDADTIDADLPDSLTVLAYSELAAIASGQPLMRELSEVSAELAQARVLHAGHVRGQAEITVAIRDLEATAAREDETAGEWHAINFVYGETTPGLMSAGRHYDGGAAASRFAELAAAAREAGQPRHLGGWHGISLQITPQPGQAGKPPAMIITASASVAWTTPVTLAVTTPRAWQLAAAPAVLTEIDQWLAAAITHAAAAETAAAAARAEAARLREQSGQPSPHAARIRDLGRRRAQIEDAVNGLAGQQAA